MLLNNEPLPLFAKIFIFFKGFDYAILRWLNSFGGRSWYFDNLVRFICDSQIIKSGIIVAVLWWLWFRPGDEQQKRGVQEKVVSALAAAITALFLARLLAFLLPFRARPIAEGVLSFKASLGDYVSPLMGWSAFPSDHAVLFFSLAMSIWYISKRLGWILFGYVFIVVCMPRMYLGLHYPTDILAGFPIGLGVSWFFNRRSVRNILSAPFIRWANAAPSWAYAVFFLISYEIAELFDQTRMVGKFVFSVIRHLFAK